MKIEVQGQTADQKNHWLRQTLTNGVFKVTFVKVNGELREMPCTLQANYLPVTPVTEATKTREYNPEVLSVWCTDKSEWRSFRVMHVKFIEPVESVV